MVILTASCMANASVREVDCNMRYNVPFGPEEERIPMCELKYVKYSSGRNLSFGSNTSTLTYQQLRVRFTESSVQVIPNVLFYEFRKMEILEMNDVGLRYIHQNSFDNADELKVFQAFSNKLSHLEAFAFMGAANLEVLDLSSNFISNIKTEAFVGLDNLKQLSLSNNRISIIDEHTFSLMKSLEWMWLDRNHLKIVSLNLLVNSQKLEGLYLNGNNISALSTLLFDKLPNLKYLFVANNNCTSKDFINVRIAMNTIVKKELEKCYKEFRAIIPDEEEKFRLKNVLRDAEKANAQCETDKASLLERLENTRQQLANLQYKNGK